VKARPRALRTMAEHMRRWLLAASLLALLTGTLVAVAVAYDVLLGQTRLHMQALAKLTAAQSQAPLLFNDAAAAEQVLRSIPSEEGISDAALLGPSGAQVAAVHEDPEPWPMSALAGLMRESVSHAIVVDGQPVGTVVLQYGGAPLARRLIELLTGLLGAVVLISIAVLVIARRLARHLTAPLTDLQSVIARARAHEDLSGRAAPCEIVEIDRLRADFHALLDQLKGREADLKRTHAVLKRLATSDRLTGLANRAMLEARLLALTGGERQVGARLGVLYFDVDSFKAVNDTLGHAVGDALLKAIAGRLKESLPAEALPARIGGDEFVVLFASLASDSELDHQAAAAQGRLEAPLQLGEVLFHPAVSVGWTAVPAEGAEAAKLLELADQAMYAAKATRRDAGHRTRWTRKDVTTMAGNGPPQQQLSQSDQLVLARLAGETVSP